MSNHKPGEGTLMSSGKQVILTVPHRASELGVACRDTRVGSQRRFSLSGLLVVGGPYCG